MTQYPRKIQKPFGGSLSVPGNVAVIGSLQAGAVAYSGDLKTLQSLSNYDLGFNGVVIGNRVISLEEFNGLMLMVTQQLSYLMQSGIPEWDADTTYYVGNVVRGVGNGFIYTSLTGGNLNNPVTDSNNWAASIGSTPAAARMTTNQVVAVDTNGHKINFTAPYISTGTNYDGPNAQFIAPVAGAYNVTAELQVDNNTGTSASMEISCRAVINGVTVAISRGESVASPPGARWYPTLGGMVPLAAGDTLEIQLAFNDAVNTGNVTVSNADWSVNKA
jgi:hypothetical protein